MNTAQKTIDSYTDEWIHIYIDRSVFKGIMNAWYGSCVQFPDQTCEELFDVCSSNYGAETRAIEEMLHHLSDVLTHMEKEKSDIMFSGAKSVLEALLNYDSTIQKLSRTIGEVITAHGIKITF